MRNDCRKLEADYGLKVTNAVELGELAEREMGKKGLRGAGLNRLARVMKVDGKYKRVTPSRWDDRPLTNEQVRYACIDAFISFEIGRRLLAGEFDI